MKDISKGGSLIDIDGTVVMKCMNDRGAGEGANKKRSDFTRPPRMKKTMNRRPRVVLA